VEWWEDEKDGNHSPPKNKWVQDSEGNEANGYPDPDSNKTKINYTKEHNEVHKEHCERRNPASNQWEFHRDVTRHDQPKHTGGTQEIPRQQK
jgi:hypothetical protein